jgi:hypothetical protein
VVVRKVRRPVAGALGVGNGDRLERPMDRLDMLIHEFFSFLFIFIGRNLTPLLK